MKPTPRQSDYIELVGRWWERTGTRTAGRILGWLMICDPPHRSSADLAAELQLSPASISTQTSALERIGLVERVTFPGDRASYFRLPPRVWLELMRARQAETEVLQGLAAAGYDVLPEEAPDRVTDLHRVASFFVDEWPGLMAKLEEHIEQETAS